MGREFMAEIEAFCWDMSFMFGNWLFGLNMDMGRKHYDEERPVIADDLTSGNETKLTIVAAIKMGNEKAESLELRIRDYKAARDAMLAVMGMKVPTAGRRYEVGKDEDSLYFVVVDGDRNATRRSFSSRNVAELHAGKLAKAYAKSHGQTATYKAHPEAAFRCWVVD